MKANIPKDIEAYFKKFPKETQILLLQLRETIAQSAPDAIEKLSYGMPAFFQQVNLVYYAAYRYHIGFYPTASGIRAFQKEIASFKNSKGAVQFPLDKPLPVKLISKMVTYRVKEVEAKSGLRKSNADFLSALYAPARRALESKGINTLKKLAAFSESDLLALHGMGPGSIPPLKKALLQAGLKLKNS